MPAPSLFSKTIGSIFVDVYENAAGLKYITITKSTKQADGTYKRDRVPVFNDQLLPLIAALEEAGPKL